MKILTIPQRGLLLFSVLLTLISITRFDTTVHSDQHEPAPVSLSQRAYLCTIEDAKQIYDGDTITKVEIFVKAMDIPDEHATGEIFPGIYLKPDGIYMQTSIRIDNIDTPEINPKKEKRDGTKRSEESIANEKKAAAAARQAVIDLITEHDLKFTITDVDFDKYGKRMVATVFVGNENVAEYLIKNNLGICYDGGRKLQLDWEALDEGLMR